MEAQAPADPRPRDAVDGLRAFARGELRIGAVRARAARAHAAAEVRWQARHASPAVRAILRRLPPPPRAGGTLGALVDDLHRRGTAGG